MKLNKLLKFIENAQFHMSVGCSCYHSKYQLHQAKMAFNVTINWQGHKSGTLPGIIKREQNCFAPLSCTVIYINVNVTINVEQICQGNQEYWRKVLSL